MGSNDRGRIFQAASQQVEMPGGDVGDLGLERAFGCEALADVLDRQTPADTAAVQMVFDQREPRPALLAARLELQAAGDGLAAAAEKCLTPFGKEAKDVRRLAAQISRTE